MGNTLEAKQTEPLENLLTARQVAAMLGFDCVQTVFNMAWRNEIPSVKIGRHARRFRPADIAEIQRNGTGPKKKAA